MFDFGMGEMMLLGTIALIAIGPKQLPEVAKTLGRFVGELKKYSGDLTRQVIEARESTNLKLMLNQQNRQNGHSGTNANQSWPNNSIPIGVNPSAATQGSINGAYAAHAASAASACDEHEHDPNQLSFVFRDFIDCYPTNYPHRAYSPHPQES